MTKFRWKQQAADVLVRDPASRSYGAAEPAAQHALHQWEYAAMCSNAYINAKRRTELKGTGETPPRARDADNGGHIELAGWSRWTDFPSSALLAKFAASGLYVDIWERVVEPRVIAVIFEGTNFSSLPDWRANLRWFLRFLPSFEDQYTIAADDLCRELFEKLYTSTSRYFMEVGSPTLRAASGEPIKLVAAGHSLGGGLAQHFAYAFQQPFASGGPKVSEVFAFDASPVTGWSVVPRGQRSYNAEGLRINRIFEHGEALAYVRLVTSRLARSTANPSVWEYRYNFGKSWNVIENHSMRLLADGLINAAGATRIEAPMATG